MDSVDTEAILSSVGTIPGSWSPGVGRSVSESKVSKRKLSLSFKRAKTVYLRASRSQYKSTPISADITKITRLSSPSFSFENVTDDDLLRLEKSIDGESELSTVLRKQAVHIEKEHIQNLHSNSPITLPKESPHKDVTEEDQNVVPVENLYEEENNQEKHNSESTFGKSTLVISLLFVITLGLLITVLIILLKQRTTTIIDLFDRMEPSHRKHVIQQLNKIYNEEPNLSGTLDLPVSTTHKSRPTPGHQPRYSRNLTNPLLYGLAYAPRKPHKPCELTYEDVELDMVKMSKITNRVRCYAVHCDQAEYIIRAILERNLNMSVSLGIWIGKNKQENSEQFEILQDVLHKYLDRNIIDCIFVGNEVLFRRDMSKAQLIKYINQTRSFISSLGEKAGQIKVGTSELGSLVGNDLASACDVLGVNVHPFFSGTPVEKSVQWVFDYLEQNIGYGLSIENRKKLTITEVGWPFAGGSFESAIANRTNAQYFFNGFIEAANVYQYPYFYFEAFDEPWKKIFYEGNNTWETEWGVFDSNRNIKVDENKFV